MESWESINNAFAPRVTVHLNSFMYCSREELKSSMQMQMDTKYKHNANILIESGTLYTSSIVILPITAAAGLQFSLI